MSSPPRAPLAPRPPRHSPGRRLLRISVEEAATNMKRVPERSGRPAKVPRPSGGLLPAHEPFQEESDGENSNW